MPRKAQRIHPDRAVSGYLVFDGKLQPGLLHATRPAHQTSEKPTFGWWDVEQPLYIRISHTAANRQTRRVLWLRHRSVQDKVNKKSLLWLGLCAASFGTNWRIGGAPRVELDVHREDWGAWRLSILYSLHDRHKEPFPRHWPRSIWFCQLRNKIHHPSSKTLQRQLHCRWAVSRPSANRITTSGHADWRFHQLGGGSITDPPKETAPSLLSI